MAGEVIHEFQWNRFADSIENFALPPARCFFSLGPVIANCSVSPKNYQKKNCRVSSCAKNIFWATEADRTLKIFWRHMNENCGGVLCFHHSVNIFPRFILFSSLVIKIRWSLAVCTFPEVSDLLAAFLRLFWEAQCPHEDILCKSCHSVTFWTLNCQSGPLPSRTWTFGMLPRNYEFVHRKLFWKLNERPPQWTTKQQAADSVGHRRRYDPCNAVFIGLSSD